MTTTTNLIDRLRTWKATFCIPVEGHPMLEAADLLETQAKQIEALRNIVTTDTETKACFIARVRAIFGKGNV